MLFEYLCLKSLESKIRLKSKNGSICNNLKCKDRYQIYVSFILGGLRNPNLNFVPKAYFEIEGKE